MDGNQLLHQIAQRPLLGDFWSQRLKEDAEWYKWEPRSENGPSPDVWQHPILGRAIVFDRPVLTVLVELSTYTYDSLALLIDPTESRYA
jgi:hypothetical protein